MKDLQETADREPATGEADSEPPLAALDGVTVVFSGRRRTVTAVREVSLTAEPGRLVCLSGRSGAGKSVTLSVLAGFLAPTSGTVNWRGEPVSNLDSTATTRRRLKLLSVLDQDADMLGDLTLRENMTLPLRADRTPIDETRSARLTKLLDALALTNLADRRPSELSGGERQRGGIGRAFLRETPLVLLDEPTSQLDERSTERVIALLRAEREACAAIVVSSHDPAVVEAADDVIHMAGVDPAK
ncbi:MAG: ABC transporter ATP-binding protein [Actinomycetaceae bacterium]